MHYWYFTFDSGSAFALRSTQPAGSNRTGWISITDAVAMQPATPKRQRVLAPAEIDEDWLPAEFDEGHPYICQRRKMEKNGLEFKKKKN